MIYVATHLDRHIIKCSHFFLLYVNLIPTYLRQCLTTADRIYGYVSELLYSLTHWGRATHICVGKLTTIGSDNGLSPGRSQAIIWTNAGILLIWPLGTNFCEILIEINTFSSKKMHLKMSSGKWRPSCLGRNVLMPELRAFHRSCITVSQHCLNPFINGAF